MITSVDKGNTTRLSQEYSTAPQSLVYKNWIKKCNEVRRSNQNTFNKTNINSCGYFSSIVFSLSLKRYYRELYIQAAEHVRKIYLHSIEHLKKK